MAILKHVLVWLKFNGEVWQFLPLITIYQDDSSVIILYTTPN
jgi:hypothetical protein